MKGYKMMNPDWTCLGMRYEVEKTYEMKARPLLCQRGFHFCLQAKDCLNYYRLTPDAHMCEVEIIGAIDGPEEGGDSKCCTNRLRIIREIPFEELMEHIIEYRLLEKNGLLLQYVENQTPEICLTAVQEYSGTLQFVKNQTKKICLTAMRKGGMALQYVKEQTPELCLAAVQQNGEALQFVKDQTPEICLAAVQQTGWALAFTKNQTPELCLGAVRQNGRALQYVENQTPEICLAAVQQDSRAISHIKDKNTKRFCCEALWGAQ